MQQPAQALAGPRSQFEERLLGQASRGEAFQTMEVFGLCQLLAGRTHGGEFGTEGWEVELT